MHAPLEANQYPRIHAAQLCWRCDPASFDFDTTDALPDLTEILGQSRALEAVQFGMGMRREGYHLYVQGPPGIGKRTLIQQLLQARASAEPTPSD